MSCGPCSGRLFNPSENAALYFSYCGGRVVSSDCFGSATVASPDVRNMAHRSGRSLVQLNRSRIKNLRPCCSLLSYLASSANTVFIEHIPGCHLVRGVRHPVLGIRHPLRGVVVWGRHGGTAVPLSCQAILLCSLIGSYYTYRHI